MPIEVWVEGKLTCDSRERLSRVPEVLEQMKVPVLIQQQAPDYAWLAGRYGRMAWERKTVQDLTSSLHLVSLPRFPKKMPRVVTQLYRLMVETEADKVGLLVEGGIWEGPDGKVFGTNWRASSIRAILLRFGLSGIWVEMTHNHTESAAFLADVFRLSRKPKSTIWPF